MRSKQVPVSGNVWSVSWQRKGSALEREVGNTLGPLKVMVCWFGAHHKIWQMNWEEVKPAYWSTEHLQLLTSASSGSHYCRSCRRRGWSSLRSSQAHCSRWGRGSRRCPPRRRREGSRRSYPPTHCRRPVRPCFWHFGQLFSLRWSWKRIRGEFER